MSTKKCSRCEKDLDSSEFYKNKKQKDGLSNWCKKCNKDFYASRKKVIEQNKNKSVEAVQNSIEILQK